MTDEVKEWWEATSEYFQDEIDLPVGVDYGPGAPDEAELGLLGDVRDAEIVELGCGGGQCGIALAKRGADVIGIDLSEEQLAYAEDLADEHDVDVDFVQGDVTRVESIETASKDIAVSANAFQWVDDLQACFSEAYRILRSDGILVFSLPHPVYQLLDPETHTVERSYFDVGRQVEEFEEMDADMVTYAHTVSGIHNTLRDVGFDVERVLEPGSSDPNDYETELWEFRPELMSKLPPTLLFKAKK